MSAAKAVLQFPEAPPSHGVNSRCLMCDGTGWRLVMIDANGDRRVTRCECRRQTTFPASKKKGRGGKQRRPDERRPAKTHRPFDFKSAAAGER